jgi:hypothetical protein
MGTEISEYDCVFCYNNWLKRKYGKIVTSYQTIKMYIYKCLLQFPLNGDSILT